MHEQFILAFPSILTENHRKSTVKGSTSPTAMWIRAFWVLEWAGIDHGDSCSCTEMHSVLGKKLRANWPVWFWMLQRGAVVQWRFGGYTNELWLNLTYSSLRLQKWLQFVRKAQFIFLLIIRLLLLIPHNICVLFPDPPAWFYSLKLSVFCFCSNVFAF